MELSDWTLSHAPKGAKFDSAKMLICFHFGGAGGTWAQGLERLEFSKASLTAGNFSRLEK